MIFVNTTNFAEILYDILKRAGYKANIIFGKMDNKEREEYVEKFRNKEINIVITTDLLSRGFDLPTIKLVINFDVPRRGQQVEYETYIHRIGRAGRFGDLGLAITLYDRDEDEEAFWDTIKHY
jgi:superfamily II DNA/RNA helicase